MTTQSLRNPYPYNQPENDNTLAGAKPVQKREYSEPTHLAQQSDPWNTLHERHTLTSSRRNVFYFDSQVPNDNLDFLLKSQYNQHSEFWKSKSESVQQLETIGGDHGRILKNRIKVIPKEKPELNHPLKIWSAKERKDGNSVKNAIEGTHTQATNKGYSRKNDGGVFTA